MVNIIKMKILTQNKFFMLILRPSTRRLILFTILISAEFALLLQLLSSKNSFDILFLDPGLFFILTQAVVIACFLSLGVVVLHRNFQLIHLSKPISIRGELLFEVSPLVRPSNRIQSFLFLVHHFLKTWHQFLSGRALRFGNCVFVILTGMSTDLY